ncbi:MAG TPA: HAMP domain-containing protein, partial [Janthinobacterium sp.]|nr:HAMP domain-containing protein [Janthinobacterium sp.]
MFKDLSIKNKLYLGFASIVAIILILLALAYNNFTRLSDANSWDKHTMQVLLQADKISNAILDVQVQARGFYLTGGEGLQSVEKNDLNILNSEIRKMLTLTVDNPLQQERLKKLDAVAISWFNDTLTPLIAQRRKLGNTPGAADIMGHSGQLAIGNPIVASMQKLIEDAKAEENQLLLERTRTSSDLQHNMLTVLSVGGLACIVLALVVSYWLGKALLAPLNNLTHAVNRIAGGEQAARADILGKDELGQVTVEFNRMAQAIQDNQANELAATNLLKAKVDALLDVVSKAASGDLTGKVTIGGGDAIGQLGNGLAKMFDNLRALLNNV